MSKQRQNSTSDPEQVLRHPARHRILLGLRAAGPMSPAELARSPIGRGYRVGAYDYHFKALHRLGVLSLEERARGVKRPVTRYRLTDHLSQSLFDAAALRAIADVLASAKPLHLWIDKPFLDEIGQFVTAAGHQIDQTC